MAHDLATINRSELSPEALAFMPVLEIQQATQRFNAVVKFVQEVMRKDVDYGAIPGTEKNVLLKPGAEKLCTLFGLSTRFEITKEIEDWDGRQSGGEALFYYRVRCSLYRGSLLIAEADGSCNSRESKYRWRWVAEDQVPHDLDKEALVTRGGRISEFDFAIDKAETTGQYGKPQAYWDEWKRAIEERRAIPIKKKTRKGSEYDAWEMDSTLYRVPNDDIASIINTVLKMAEKRALVAATLIAVNASEFFTQDVEDMDIIDVPYVPAPEVEAPPAPPVNGARKQAMPMATEEQRDEIEQLCQELFNIRNAQMDNWLSEYFNHGLDDLTHEEAEQALEFLRGESQARQEPVVME